MFLGTGIITDFLKEVGTTEVARDSLKMDVNKPASWSAQIAVCSVIFYMEKISIVSTVYIYIYIYINIKYFIEVEP